MSVPSVETAPQPPHWKLWLYTNYDCNLRCSYCVAESSPTALRRALGRETVERLVAEAAALGFGEVFFTGGEPFILADIYAMLAFAAARLKTTVLTNGMLLHGARLKRLAAVADRNLSVQVSLDGATADAHDAYRGRGTWEQTVAAIRRLQEAGLHVRLSTTETPANRGSLEAICALHLGLGIPEADNFVRPLAKRGFSAEGLELGMAELSPEVTVNVDGVFWHPLSTSADMQVSRSLFPLAEAVKLIEAQLETIARTGRAAPSGFT